MTPILLYSSLGDLFSLIVILLLISIGFSFLIKIMKGPFFGDFVSLACTEGKKNYLSNLTGSVNGSSYIGIYVDKHTVWVDGRFIKYSDCIDLPLWPKWKITPYASMRIFSNDKDKKRFLEDYKKYKS